MLLYKMTHFRIIVIITCRQVPRHELGRAFLSAAIETVQLTHTVTACSCTVDEDQWYQPSLGSMLGSNTTTQLFCEWCFSPAKSFSSRLFRQASVQRASSFQSTHWKHGCCRPWNGGFCKQAGYTHASNHAWVHLVDHAAHFRWNLLCLSDSIKEFDWKRKKELIQETPYCFCRLSPLFMQTSLS